jgi:hypothetical protein
MLIFMIALLAGLINCIYLIVSLSFELKSFLPSLLVISFSSLFLFYGFKISDDIDEVIAKFKNYSLRFHNSPIQDVPKIFIIFILLYPFLFLVFKNYIAYMISNNFVDISLESIAQTYLWVPVFILINFFLFYADYKSMELYGINVKHGLVSIFIFTPLYLYYRGIAIKSKFELGLFRSQFPFILYIILNMTIIYFLILKDIII